MEGILTNQLQADTPAGAVEASAFMEGVFESEAGGKVRLLVGHCSSCGAYSFPRRDVCQHCGPDAEIASASVEGGGHVYASTVVHVPSPVGIKSPYAYGYVDLDQIPLRVFGLFARADAEGLAPGTPVRLVTEALCQDSKRGELFTYKFTRLGEAA
tara:strand:- start:104 stop:571 length:468 start_codon:yes stop_codon:yes gene_type:complete